MFYDRFWDNFEKFSLVKKKLRGRIYYVLEIFSELLMKIYMFYLKKKKNLLYLEIKVMCY